MTITNRLIAPEHMQSSASHETSRIGRRLAKRVQIRLVRQEDVPQAFRRHNAPVPRIGRPS